MRARWADQERMDISRGDRGARRRTVPWLVAQRLEDGPEQPAPAVRRARRHTRLRGDRTRLFELYYKKTADTKRIPITGTCDA
jgi:hypothetical protein